MGPISKLSVGLRKVSHNNFLSSECVPKMSVLTMYSIMVSTFFPRIALVTFSMCKGAMAPHMLDYQGKKVNVVNRINP
jgi:hypothetical protein